MDKIQLKNMMSSSPNEISINELTTNHIGRLRIKILNTKFELFFIPSKFKRLYISLSAIGKDGRDYPIFNRGSWSRAFEGMFLCIDDPTRYETKIAPTYFFGTKNVNYIDLLCTIITKFKEIYNLNNNNLCFISSSNGGFVAIKCSEVFNGCNCISLCPQLDIPLYYKGNNKFEKKFDINFNDNEFKERLNIYNTITKNNNSNIIIFSNIKSHIDKIQIDSFFNYINKKYSNGLQQINNNTYFFIASIDAVDPHLSQPNLYHVRLLEDLILNSGNNKIKYTICNTIEYDLQQYHTLNKEYLTLNK